MIPLASDNLKTAFQHSRSPAFHQCAWAAAATAWGRQQRPSRRRRLGPDQAAVSVGVARLRVACLR